MEVLGALRFIFLVTSLAATRDDGSGRRDVFCAWWFMTLALRSCFSFFFWVAPVSTFFRIRGHQDHFFLDTLAQKLDKEMSLGGMSTACE